MLSRTLFFHLRRLRTTTVFGAGLLCLGLSRGQETLSSLQREMDRVERETEREKELHKSERARALEFDRRKTEKLQALREQLRIADVRMDSLRRQSETERKRRAGNKGQVALFQSKQKEFRAAVGREISALTAWTERDFPFQKEKRVSDWHDLAKANEEAALPVEEILARFFSLTQASGDFAQNTEAYPGTYVANDGGQYEGYYVRLGAVALMFGSSDGERMAYLAKTDSGYAWRDKDLTPGTRNGIMTALQVAQGKVAPQLVALPVEPPRVKESGQ